MNYDKLSKVQFNEQLKRFQELYSKGTPEISDDDFDYLVDMYTSKFGKWDVIGREGSQQLPFYMFSLDKIKNGDTEKLLNDWMKKNPGPYVIMDKMDGCSIGYDGYETFTRGNGYAGENVTNKISYLNLPSINEFYGVRGEFVMTKNNFKIFVEIKKAEGSKNKLDKMLSAVCGILTKDEVNIEELKLCDFVAFELVNSQLPSIIDNMKILKSMGFKISWYVVYDIISIPLLSEILNIRKSESEYDIDGLVVLSDNGPRDNEPCNPSYAIAYKEDVVETAVVKDIEWNLSSKDALIKPTVILESLRVDNRNMGRSTGWNARQIIDKGIGKGAILEVAFCVVPVIKGVKQEATSENMIYPPYDYEWNETEVDFILIDTDIPEVRKQQILHFFKTLDIDYVKEATISNLYDAGYDTLKKLFNMKVEDISGLPRMGVKSAEKCITNIMKAITNVKLELVMAGSCVFGRNIGVRVSKSIIPLIMKNGEFVENSNLYNSLLDIDNIGEIFATRIAKRIPLFIDWLKEHNEISLDLSKNESSNLFADLTNKEVLFTGFVDFSLSGGGSLKILLEKNGVIVKGNFVKTLTMLITKDMPSTNTKYTKAVEANEKGKNIEIILLDSFLERYNLN